MFRNNLLVALRNLKRNKTYTILNILGLAIGISGFIVVSTIIFKESQFNSYHIDENPSVYRVVSRLQNNDDVQHITTVPHPLGDGMRLEFPDVEAITMMYAMGNLQVNIEDEAGLRLFKDDGVCFANNDIFEILHFEWASTFNPNALIDPNSVVISTKMAQKYYNISIDYQSLIGKTIRLANQKNLVIKGVYKDFPKDTDFPLELIAHYNDQEGINRYFGEGKIWQRFNGSTNCLIKLNPSVDATAFASKLDILNEKYNIMEGLEFGLQPMSEVHTDARYFTYSGYTFDDSTKITLSLIGSFLLLIACINFINLSTAQAVKRSKEVGIRKVLGSNQSKLILQFLTETFFVVAVAHVLGLGFAELWFQFISIYIEMDLALSVFSSFEFTLFFGTSIIATTLLAGLYPSFVVSSFSPIEALKIRLSNTKSKGGLSLRRVLVIVQFIITQSIIMGTVIVMYQFDYLIEKDLGFDKDGIVSIIIPKENRDRVSVFITELERENEIEIGSTHIGSPVARTNNTSEYFLLGDSTKASTRFNVKPVDEKYLEVFDIKLLAGNNIKKGEESWNVLVNLKAVESLGIDKPENAIGKVIATEWGDKVVIKGVVSDFNSFSLQEEMTAIILQYQEDYFDELAFKLSFDNPKARKKAIVIIEAEWKKHWPNHIMDYDFVDNILADSYKQEGIMSILLKAFTFISIFISCLGIYGLIDFMANRKQKEIGIRKVLGASVSDIVIIFSKEIIILLIISFAIASPIIYVAMNNWLNSFAYKIDIGIGVLIFAFAISLVLTLATIAYRSIKASNMNPVISLKDE